MTIPTPALLFVYGTLRRGCDNDMARHLAYESRLLGPAQMRGHLYRIENPDSPAYPSLTPDEDGAFVTGDLLALPDPEITLGWLDIYEEAGPAFPAPQEYRREMLPVKTSSATYEAWMYIYNWPVTGRRRINSGDWLRPD